MDYEIIEKRPLFQGYYRIDGYRLRHRRFDGSWSGEMSREVFERGSAIAVIMVDPDRDAIVMIEQFRMGALAAGMHPWLMEVVAGVIEPGEAPEDVARREAVEESGCALKRLELITRFLPSPGACSETVTLFCAEVDASTADGVHGVDSEHEDIKVHVLPIAEALRLFDENRLDNGIAFIAVAWLARNYTALKARWRPDGAAKPAVA